MRTLNFHGLGYLGQKAEAALALFRVVGLATQSPQLELESPKLGLSFSSNLSTTGSEPGAWTRVMVKGETEVLYGVPRRTGHDE